VKGVFRSAPQPEAEEHDPRDNDKGFSYITYSSGWWNSLREEWVEKFYIGGKIFSQWV